VEVFMGDFDSWYFAWTAAAAVSAIGLGGLVVAFVMGREIGRVRKYADNEFRSLDARLELLRHPTRPEAKRELFLSQAVKTFYYLDEHAVESQHVQVFGRLQPRGVEAEAKTTSGGGLLARLGPLRGSLRGERSGAERVTYDVARDPGVKYNEVERFLLENDQVTLGLEDFAADDPSIDKLRDMCAEMKQTVGFEIPDEMQERFIRDKREAAAKRKLDDLAAAHDYVIMRGHFRIQPYDGGWTLVYAHPASADLGGPVTIAVDCAREGAKQSAILSTSPSLEATLLAKVTYFDGQARQLKLMPIAVY
jgi:hypothetical protein